MMNKLKAVIFDLDGVIVDTARFHYIAWRKMANDLGFDITLEQNEQLKGVSRVHSLNQILGWGNIQVSQPEFEALMRSKNEHYLELISNLNQEDLLPGVQPILDYLHQHQVPFALGSASRNARAILKGLKIDGMFSAIVDGNDVTKAKPHPEVFLIAAEKLGVAPDQCLVFEDAQAGVEAANRAGMRCVGIGDQNILGKADYVFSDFSQINTEFINQHILTD